MGEWMIEKRTRRGSKKSIRNQINITFIIGIFDDTVMDKNQIKMGGSRKEEEKKSRMWN